MKPSAGGGGKGMQIARDADELAAALPAARRIALAAFGDDTLLIERLIERPRHIEVQVLADAHGAVVHLGERECSLQRRHQKVIEESPSPLLDAATRSRIGQAACDAARSVDYLGAGTVEFLVSDAAPDEFFFIEMNTRLQVEHPVTELVTGIDLVEQQLRIAAGEPLAFAQEEIRLQGHAIEARVYAETPHRGFLPSTGAVLAWRAPAGEGVRVDAGIDEGLEITAHYDPMIAKVIAYGSDRAQALDRLDRALADTVVLGVDTNIAFLRRLLADTAVRSGDLDTGLIDRMPEGDLAGLSPSLVDAAARRFAREEVADRLASTAAGPRTWQSATGWRPGSVRPPEVLLAPRDHPHDIRTVVAEPDGAAPARPGDDGRPGRRRRFGLGAPRWRVGRLRAHRPSCPRRASPRRDRTRRRPRRRARPALAHAGNRHRGLRRGRRHRRGGRRHRRHRGDEDGAPRRRRIRRHRAAQRRRGRPRES